MSDRFGSPTPEQRAVLKKAEDLCHTLAELGRIAREDESLKPQKSGAEAIEVHALKLAAEVDAVGTQFARQLSAMVRSYAREYKEMAV